MAVMTQHDPVQLAYFIASVLDLGTETEQKMLESSTVDGLLTLTHAALARELEIMQIRSKIATEAQTRDGQIAARLRPSPADEGDPKGTRRRRNRRKGRGRTASRAARKGRPSR